MAGEFEVARIEHLNREQLMVGTDGAQRPIPIDRAEKSLITTARPRRRSGRRSASMPSRRSPRTVGELRWVVAIFFNGFCACARPTPGGIARSRRR